MNKKPLYLIGVLFVVGFLIYSFNLHNKLFWDDEDWIINNQFIHSLSWTNIKFWFTHNTLAGIGLKSNYYRPFLFFTFALNYLVSGTSALGYHLVSNLIHIANAMMVFVTIRKLFKKDNLAFLVSLIFLIHPLQTEAVSYIAGRGDLLVALFMLLGMWFFLKNQDKNSILNVSLTLTFLVLALLSRETAIVFPLVLLIVYISLLSKERFLKSFKNGLIKTWPYFLIVIVYGILRLTVLNFLNTLNFYTQPNVYSENLYIRFFTFLSTLLTYFKLLIIPVGLHMERATYIFDSLFKWPVFLGTLLVVNLLYLVFRFYKKQRIQSVNYNLPTTDYRVWLFGIGWFVATIAPVSGITPINALMYEHWLYLPMIGFFIVACFYVTLLLEFFKNKNKLILYWLIVCLLGFYFAFYAYQSITRNILWGNAGAFYLDILKYEPDSGRVNNNLGNLYFNKGDHGKAEIYYKKAIETADTFPQSHFNYGSILDAKGDNFGAAQEYKKAIEIDPNFYYAHQGLVILYAKTGNIKEAIIYVEQLKKILSENPRVYYNAALLYIADNNKEMAIKSATEGLNYIKFDPATGPLLEDLIKRVNSPPRIKKK